MSKSTKVTWECDWCKKVETTYNETLPNAWERVELTGATFRDLKQMRYSSNKSTSEQADLCRDCASIYWESLTQITSFCIDFWWSNVRNQACGDKPRFKFEKIDLSEVKTKKPKIEPILASPPKTSRPIDI